MPPATMASTCPPRRQKHGDDHCRHGDRRALAVGRQAGRHGDHGLGNDRDRRGLQLFISSRRLRGQGLTGSELTEASRLLECAAYSRSRRGIPDARAAGSGTGARTRRWQLPDYLLPEFGTICSRFLCRTSPARAHDTAQRISGKDDRHAVGAFPVARDLACGGQGPLAAQVANRSVAVLDRPRQPGPSLRAVHHQTAVSCRRGERTPRRRRWDDGKPKAFLHSTRPRNGDRLSRPARRHSAGRLHSARHLVRLSSPRTSLPILIVAERRGPSRSRISDFRPRPRAIALGDGHRQDQQTCEPHDGWW